ARRRVALCDKPPPGRPGGGFRILACLSVGSHAAVPRSNHGDATSPWSGPRQSHIVVVGSWVRGRAAWWPARRPEKTQSARDRPLTQEEEPAPAAPRAGARAP